MRNKKTKTVTKINRYKITPTDRIEILWREISKGDSSYDFYDIKYGECIITGCRVVEGKKGNFIGMPSRENNGEYYPVVFLSHALSDKLIEFIEQADDNDDWIECEDNEMLSFENDNKKAGKTKKRKDDDE